MNFLKCLLGYHKPVRNEVVREVVGYCGNCQSCGKAIRRVRRGRWVARGEL